MCVLELYIKNYQLIEEGRLEFQSGLNCIIGESNNSKSSIIRAMETLCFNLPREKHITFGKTEQIIGVQYQGHQIVYKRDTKQDSQVSYLVNGQLYTKVGRQPLPAVMESLNIREVVVDDFKYHPNFSKQMSHPFLTDKSPSQLFKFLISSNSKHNLLDVHNAMKDDLQQLNKDYTISEVKREENQKQLIFITDSINSILSNTNKTREEYSDYIDKKISFIQSVLIPKENFLEKLKNSSNTHANLKQNRILTKKLEKQITTKLTNILRGISSQEIITKETQNIINKQEQIIRINKLIEIRNNITLIKNRINKFNSLKPTTLTKSDEKEYQLLSDYCHIKNKLNTLLSTLIKLNTLNIVPQQPTSTTLHTLLSQHTNVTQQKQQLSNQLTTLTQQKEELKQSLSQFQYCPYCNGKINL